ncbi:hypothetical protein JIX56_25180 [Streptomyces sp. CA-210063]|uniref:hypothetical protein n=1 Tax=Streptomyces sp. CA-210063 TaxID=2801029 RepID=UPI00214BF6F7|nr:hypothetical protein [Streptomyces sp. CA-210063]UUU32903.1 hypothetical protein JIX56_25180 [Streptomyces sp. CA-210063]
MSNQPYGHEGHQGHHGHQGYEGYQQPQQAQHYGAQAQPQWQGYDESQQYTQQWEGQTWETQIQAQAQAQTAAAADLTETAYVPAQADGQYAQYGQYAPQPQPQPQAQAQPRTAPVAEPEPGYGPATVTGNTRVTDAQRARAEGRSPIIEPGMQPALITAVLGLLLAGAAAIGEYALAVPLVILQAVTAAGWFRLNGMWPARQGIVLAFAGALAADVALFAAGRGHAPAAILGTLGVWVLLGIVLGLRSHADPDERMYGLMATVASAALSIIAAGYLAAVADAVTVGGIAVAVAVLARALPLPTPASVVVALLAATGAGIAVGGATDLGTSGALLGGAAGLCALIGHRVAAYDYPSRFVHFTAGVALPLTAAAPAVYLLGRTLA